MNLYGQPATVLVAFSTTSGKPTGESDWNVTWSTASKQGYIDISSFRIDTEKLYWYISVTGADSALNTADDIREVQGMRKPAEGSGTVTEGVDPSRIRRRIVRFHAIHQHTGLKPTMIYQPSINRYDNTVHHTHQGVSR